MHLHIVSFNVPWPADYGGVIDVYHRIAALAGAGIKVHLHCYTYGRGKAAKLETICEEVCYYRRETGFRHQLNRKPYIVSSRCSKSLLNRLKQDNYPILLEGLHCCRFLPELATDNRTVIVRAHNVEHEYYDALSKVESKKWKKLFYDIEAHKLRRYETIIKKATAVMAISENDAGHFRAIGCSKVFVMPPSCGHQIVSSKEGRGSYVLYHGNLSVPENIKAVHYILENIVPKCHCQFIVAGLNPDMALEAAVSKYANVRLVANPDESTMHKLIADAQVNLLVTDQATGVKLKLMNALYEGRFCLVNSLMVQGTTLAPACVVTDDSVQLCSNVMRMMSIDFTEKDIEERRKLLEQADPIKDLLNIIF